MKEKLRLAEEESSFAAETGVCERLEAQYHRLTNSMRKVADYVLQNPRTVVYRPITELAELCGVSEFTVMKLCKSIGLSGYHEFKLLLAKKYVKPIENIHEEVEEDDHPANIAVKLATSYLTALESTRDFLDMGQIQAAVTAINKAKRLEFYGMGTSSCVAKDAYHKFFRLNFECRFLEDSHMQAMSAALLAKGDVAVAISNSGGTKDLIEALKVAKEAGATTICVTSQPKAPLTKVADIRIIAKTPENLYRGEPMENRIAQIYVMDLLFIAVALGRKDSFLLNLERTRRALTGKKL